MRARGLFKILWFTADRIRMACLALALVVAVKIMGAAILNRLQPMPENAGEHGVHGTVDRASVSDAGAAVRDISQPR
ncbi:MAG: hypothetical protein AB7O04_04160 [Hyphomonadaceae bacterium]